MTSSTDRFDPAVQAWQLKRFRSDLGLTQSEAADLVGVSNFTWWRWEEGQRPITEYYRDKIREKREAFQGRNSTS